MDSKTTVDRFVGIDVAKNSLEVHVRPDKLAFGCGTDADSPGCIGAASGRLCNRS